MSPSADAMCKPNISNFPAKSPLLMRNKWFSNFRSEITDALDSLLVLFGETETFSWTNVMAKQQYFVVVAFSRPEHDAAEGCKGGEKKGADTL